jgi:hypothetical protein
MLQSDETATKSNLRTHQLGYYRPMNDASFVATLALNCLASWNHTFPNQIASKSA